MNKNETMCFVGQLLSILLIAIGATLMIGFDSTFGVVLGFVGCMSFMIFLFVFVSFEVEYEN